MATQREWFEKNYYKVLGVSEKATQKDITRAYRKLARETHPDAHPGKEDRFKEVSTAYDVIGDPDKRKEYDEVRKLGPAAAGFGGQGSPFGGGGGGGFRVDDLGDFGDLFGGIFSRGGGGSGGRSGQSRGTGPQRGTDLEAGLHLSFNDAAVGVTTAVNVTSEARCTTCHGSGAKPGTMPKPCPACGGRGAIDDNQGPFSFSAPCPNCAGQGKVIDSPCSICRGAGVEHRPRSVKVRIPAGVADGQRIRLKGRGEPGRHGGPTGDLYVVVHVATHPLFGRVANNLTINVPITYPEAVLGADITVPTFDNGTVTLRVPAGTRSGRTFRVKEKGVPGARGQLGDLLVTVEVAVPVELSDAQRKAVEALAAASEDSSPRGYLGV
ncbi:MAG: molecular chaperone DnaJ [Acidimicrobiales bacterium]